jgi:iron(III) transport system permease protein
VRTRSRLNWCLEQLFGLPLVVPGIVLGLSLLLFYLYVPIPLYGTLWIIVLAYVTAFATYGMRYLQPALIQVGAELEEAAVVGGARWWAVWRRVLLPLLAPALLGAFLFVFFHSFRELSAAALLYTGDTSVVSTQLLDMWTNGNLSVLSAFGSIVTAVSIACGALVYLLGRRWLVVMHQ